MAAVKWDGTQKVRDLGYHTITLTDDAIKNPMSFENNNIQSPKKKKTTTQCYILKFFNLLLPNSRWSTEIYWTQVI